jgi:hypothetical protein
MIYYGGSPRAGYDLGSATSLGLLAWAAGAGAGTPTTSAVLAATGGLSAAANLIKSYQHRTGRPHELIEH